MQRVIDGSSRIVELEQENAGLKQQISALQKDFRRLYPKPAMVFPIIIKWQEQAAGIKASTRRLCRVLEVSRSGLHETVLRMNKPVVPCPIKPEIEKLFEQNAGTYGSRRISDALKAKGMHVGRYRVRKMMRELGLQTHYKRTISEAP